MLISTKSNIRIDLYLKDELNLSRSKVQKLIKEGKVLVNDKVISDSYLVKEQDNIMINNDTTREFNIVGEDIPLDIIYEDEYLLIINKKSGMVVHPAPGHYSETLVNALLGKYDFKFKEKIRPGIVHRLDKDTSGLMVVAKDPITLEKLSEMIAKKEIERHYLALVSGIIKEDSATVDAPIGRDPNNRQKMKVIDGGKEAITHFNVLKRYQKATLIECILETGRTHQIRVHLAYIKHPVLNDPLYGKCYDKEFGQMLHSKSIKFTHPITKKELFFEVKPPIEFINKIGELESV